MAAVGACGVSVLAFLPTQTYTVPYENGCMHGVLCAPCGRLRGLLPFVLVYLRTIAQSAEPGTDRELVAGSGEAGQRGDGSAVMSIFTHLYYPVCTLLSTTASAP